MGLGDLTTGPADYRDHSARRTAPKVSGELGPEDRGEHDDGR